jgi:hypothetical protein
MFNTCNALSITKEGNSNETNSNVVGNRRYYQCDAINSGNESFDGKVVLCPARQDIDVYSAEYTGDYVE